jgi:hypothetical protein
MKKASVLFIVILAATMFLTASTKSTSATYSEGVTIVINSDGSVTPSSAPVVRSGNTYLVTDDILMPRSTNEGIKVERDNIVLDGAGQNLPGADGIGDTPVGEEIFNQGGTNVDNYPLMSKQVISNPNPNPSISPSASASPIETSNPTDEPSSTATTKPTPSPSVPEFPSTVLIGLFIIPAVAGALLTGKNSPKRRA